VAISGTIVRTPGEKTAVDVAIQGEHALDSQHRTGLSRRTIVKAGLAAPAVALLPAVARHGRRPGLGRRDDGDRHRRLGDQNFNDLAFRAAPRRRPSFGVDFRVIESVDQAAYVPNLTQAATDSQLTVGVGFLLTDAITEVAAQFPDKFFQLIDSVSDAGNVQSVLFKEEQIGYLAGIVVGETTQSNKIGIIGGQRIPPVIRYEVGFVAGVRSVNPEAEVTIVYTDTSATRRSASRRPLPSSTTARTSSSRSRASPAPAPTWRGRAEPAGRDLGGRRRHGAGPAGAGLRAVRGPEGRRLRGLRRLAAGRWTAPSRRASRTWAWPRAASRSRRSRAGRRRSRSRWPAPTRR
jgi:hypothetical protein